MCKFLRNLFIFNCISTIFIGIFIIVLLFLLIRVFVLSKLVVMLSPLFWVLTLYFSMVFYYLWYQEDKNNKYAFLSPSVAARVTYYKKIYRLVGFLFGFLLFISLFFK